MRAKIIKTSLILSLVLTLNACGKKDNYTNNIAIVDGNPISKETYTEELEFYQKFYTQEQGEDYLEKEVQRGKSNNDILQKELVDSLIKDQVMINDSKQNKIKVDDNIASSIRNDLEKSLGGKESLKANVAALEVSESNFNDILYNDSIRKQHYDYFLSNNDIKDSDILEFYKSNDKYQRQYKYNVLVFDDENLANKIRKQINSSEDFKGFLNKSIKNYDIINSDFVYEDDHLLKESKIKEKNNVSNVFSFDNKYMILMVNSYNDNENELLLKTKDIYLKEKYEEYLNKLVKKSKIRVFI